MAWWQLALGSKEVSTEFSTGGITRLLVMGIPGGRHTFVAKTPSLFDVRRHIISAYMRMMNE